MPPGVTLAAELVDDIDKFFGAIESRCDFRKGREVRVRESDLVPDTISPRLIALAGAHRRGRETER